MNDSWLMEVGAFDLKFKYPQHFNRLFKQHVVMFPNDYRGIK